ncbi:MAG: acylphosphatase [Desulfobacterales bacterium]|nr:acylphosphatase [Desulfobacterales bacterium]
MADKKRVRAIIEGRVQGVNFRMETMRAAEQIGVNGWVRNKSDGNVEALIEGDAEKVDQMLEWCRKGPPVANVTDIDITEETYKGDMQGFDVRYTM